MAETKIIIPDISEDLNQYKQLVNADKNPHIARTIQQELDDIYFDENREPRTEKEVAKRLAAYQMSIKARVDQIMGMDPSAFDHRQAKSQKDFESAPRTRLKLAQELFSSPADYQVVTREEIAIGEEADLIWDMVMDPSKITESALIAMGLDELLPKNLETHLVNQRRKFEDHLPKSKKSRNRRMTPAVKAELMTEAIGYVKHFFANCIEPLTLEHEDARPRARQVYFRLFRITEGPNAGMILGTQVEGDKKILFLTDIASAARRIDHISDDRYGAEIEKLKNVEAILKEMSRKLDTEDWDEIKSSGDLEKMKTKIVAIVEKLKFVKNENKQEILRRVERCTTFRDVKGRLNPTSRRAIWESAIRFIGERIGEIEGISGYLGKDRVRVMAHIREEAERLQGFYRQVEEHAGKLKIVDLKKPLDETAVTRMVTNLRALIASCEDFKFEPYISLAARMISEINVLIGLLNSEDRNDPQKREEERYSFVRIYSIAKLLNLEDELITVRDEWFYPGYSSPERIYAKGLMDRLKGVRERFQGKRVAVDTEMKDLSPIYGEIYRFLNEVISELGQGIARGKTEKDRIDAVKKVGAMLKEFSVAELLRNPEFQMKS